MIAKITSLESQYSRLNAGLDADIEAFQPITERALALRRCVFSDA
jgi:hypothetical protein